MKIERRSGYFRWGLTAITVVTFCMLIYFAIDKMDVIVEGIDLVTGILMPFILGLILAYLLCPLYKIVVNRCENIKWPNLLKNKKNPTRPFLFLNKFLATIVCLIVLFTIVAGLLAMIIPQLVESIIAVGTQFPGWITTLILKIEEIFKDVPVIADFADEILNTLSSAFDDWFQQTVIPNSQVLLDAISSGIFGILGWVVDIFVAIIICVFFLNSREIFAAQIKKLLFALTSKEKAVAFLKGSTFVNRTFNGFITGKLLDSVIVAIICFVVMSIFDWPFVALISVIIGVTNIIPFFGPFIGAIPATLLIMMVDVRTGIYFVIFILILQQVDGNIIGPKILGNSTGISSFWVLFAILVGGGLFGFIGMIVGIPIFACVYAYICFKVNKRLEKKGLSINLDDYKFNMEDAIREKEKQMKKEESEKE